MFNNKFEKNRIVEVTLKDDTKIYGFYGEKSYIGNNLLYDGIYLEKKYIKTDKDFIPEKETDGILIPASIKYIKFFK